MIKKTNFPDLERLPPHNFGNIIWIRYGIDLDGFLKTFMRSMFWNQKWIMKKKNAIVSQGNMNFY